MTAVRGFTLALLAFWGLAVTAARAEQTLPGRPAKSGEILSVPLAELHPTQMEIGRAAVRLMLASWQKEAADRGISFPDYARTVLKPKMEAKPLPGIISPEGLVHNTDGHHRVESLLEVTRLTGVEFQLPVEVQRDYRGHSQKAYARHLVKVIGKGYFTPETRRLSPVEQVAQLPHDYHQIVDNPLRSAVGTVLYRKGIDSGHMKDFIEFDILEKAKKAGALKALGRAGISPQEFAADPLSERSLKILEPRLTSPLMVQLMRQSARNPKSAAAVNEQIKGLYPHLLAGRPHAPRH